MSWLSDALGGDAPTPPKPKELDPATQALIAGQAQSAMRSGSQFGEEINKGINERVGQIGQFGSSDQAQTGMDPAMFQAMRNAYSGQTGSYLRDLKEQGALMGEQRKSHALRQASQFALQKAQQNTNYYQTLTDSYNQMEAQRAQFVSAISGLASYGIGTYAAGRKPKQSPIEKPMEQSIAMNQRSLNPVSSPFSPIGYEESLIEGEYKMPNYGMLAGLTNGLKEGLIAYQTKKQIDRTENQENLLKGMQKNPETGELEYTPQKKQQMDLQSKMQQQQVAQYEPGSGAKALGGLLGEGVVPEGMSLAEAKDIMPALVAKMKKPGIDSGADLNQAYKQAQIDYLKQKTQTEKIKPTLKQEQLPLENKITVSNLAQKNANKLSIANQIDSVISGWDKLSDQNKIVQGRQLLKTLNSTEGADAIGTEEAKRLGGLLEYNMLNITEPGPMFGRDLSGFKDQASLTSKGIRNAIKSNQKVIEDLTGRKGLIGEQPKTEEKPEIIKQGGHTYRLNKITGEYE